MRFEIEFTQGLQEPYPVGMPGSSGYRDDETLSRHGILHSASIEFQIPSDAVVDLSRRPCEFGAPAGFPVTGPGGGDHADLGDDEVFVYGITTIGLDQRSIPE